MFTEFTSAECRSKADANLAQAERGGPAREQMLADAAAWMLLADRLDSVESALAEWRRSLH
jgi:hypothetical protein